MLVTSKYLEHPIPALGGCLAHLVSDDLLHWTVQEPFLIPGFTDPPECPDLFEWNGWYYLIFSNRLQARYRMARTPFGPWQRPALDLLDGPWTRVMKTAPYHDNRRLGVAWIGTRSGDTDTGRFQWGGHAIFREMIQFADGTLGTTFPPEMLPARGAPIALPQATHSVGATVENGVIHLESSNGMAAVSFSNLPRNIYMRISGRPAPHTPRFGLRLRESAPFVDGIAVELLPTAQRIEMHDTALDPVAWLDSPFTLEIILKDDLIDLSVNGCYSLINRCPEQQGTGITFFCHTGSITFDEIIITPLLTQ